ncbi:mitochondrial import protein Pam17 [Serendipita vermifera]|nr:mitochondrial import protein Pam17 [Serendipita vermifera]
MASRLTRLQTVLPASSLELRTNSQRIVYRGVESRRAKSTQADASTTPGASESKDTLSWSDYLTIRGRKRKWELATTIPITSAAAAGGFSYFGVHTPQFMGLDPLLMCILATAGVSGLGYLIGPVIGSQMWRLTHRKTMSLIEDKDREFHQHIRRNRVDPSTQSTTNPVPDFYGEKIGSMKEYRQWLRDQARYRRKASWGATK